MSNMHEVDGLADILTAASACDEVDTVLRLAREKVSDLITEACKITLKTVTFLQFWTKKALSTSPTMLMLDTPRRCLVTGVTER